MMAIKKILNMKTARVIAFIAFVLNSLFTVFSVFIFFKVGLIFEKLEAQTSFPWTIFILFIFVILSFIFWLYLKNKEKKGKIVKFALWVSIALLLIPWLFLLPAAMGSIFQPLYNLSRTLD